VTTIQGTYLVSRSVRYVLSAFRYNTRSQFIGARDFLFAAARQVEPHLSKFDGLTIFSLGFEEETVLLIKRSM